MSSPRGPSIEGGLPESRGDNRHNRSLLTPMVKEQPELSDRGGNLDGMKWGGGSTGVFCHIHLIQNIVSKKGFELQIKLTDQFH